MTRPIPQRVALRALNRCVQGTGGCKLSTYSTGSHGYAQIGWQDDYERTVTTAHRAAWVAANGRQIPDGMTVDHICHVRPCVNPEHLRLLPNVENARDNGFASRTHCPQGHPYDFENTRLVPGRRGGTNRKCRRCGGWKGKAS
jgi:hypothetical protein